MPNAHQQFVERKAKEFDKEIYEQGTRNIGHALAHTEHFREVLAFALQDRLGQAGANIIMSLIDKAESTYMVQ
jgi:hypothetical protein